MDLRRIASSPQVCARDGCSGVADSVDAIRGPNAAGAEVGGSVVGAAN